MQAAAGLGGGANAQPVQEADAEGGAAVSGHTASRCPPVVNRCIVGSHKAVSVCFMFFLANLWINRFPPSLLLPSASYRQLPGSRPRRRERQEKLVHACRQPSSPQSVLTWSSPSLCVSNQKEEREAARGAGRGRRGRAEQEEQVLSAFHALLRLLQTQSSPRGPRCSVLPQNLRVITAQSGPAHPEGRNTPCLDVACAGLHQGLVPCPACTPRPPPPTSPNPLP